MEHTESQRNSNAKLTLILDTIVPKLTSTIIDLIGHSGEIRKFSDHCEHPSI